jgi:hypothetical protein
VLLDILVLLFHQDCDACKPNCFQGFLFLQMCIAIPPVQVFRACIVQPSSLQGSEISVQKLSF